MVAAKNTTELYNGDFERLTTADEDRAYCGTLYNEGIYVGKYLVKDLTTNPHGATVGEYGYCVCSSIADSCLGTLLVQIYVDRVMLSSIDGVVLTRAAATNFLCGVMDAINEVDEFSDVAIVELYTRKDITGGGTCVVKFAIGEFKPDPKNAGRPVSKLLYQGLSKNN